MATEKVLYLLTQFCRCKSLSDLLVHLNVRTLLSRVVVGNTDHVTMFFDEQESTGAREHKKSTAFHCMLQVSQAWL